MGEIAGVTPRFLGLRLAMREQLVDLLGQRPDFGREIVADPGLLARADGRDLVAHPAQRPQAVEGLQRGEHEQAEAERGEAPEERSARRCWIWSSSVSRDCATWNRQRTVEPGRIASRSAIRSGSAWSGVENSSLS